MARARLAPGEDDPDFTALVEVGEEQELLDAIGGAIDPANKDRLVLLPIETTVPKIEEPDEPDPAPKPSRSRVSREELHDDLSDASKLSWNYVAMVVLAAGVVTIGLVRDSATVVIGGMVLAPLLGPNIALAFAATLGDGKLAGRALRTSLSGLGIALALGILVGLFGGLELDAEGAIVRAEILARTQPHVLDLLLTNLVWVNFAAVLTFLAQAVRPRHWWDVQRSRRVVRVVILSLLVALAIVSVLVAVGPFSGS